MALRNGRTSAVVKEIIQGSIHPAGSLISFAGVNAPQGWLLCHGQTISRTTYSELFLALSTTYGVGDGSTTFNLPDLRGRVPAGKDDMGGSAANRLTSGGSGVNGVALGAAGGAQTHTLSTAQLASHNHTQNSHNHTQNPHDHNFQIGGDGAAASNIPQRTVNNLATGTTFNNTATNQASTATNNSEGSGSAHQNTQPSIILNYIIKV